MTLSERLTAIIAETNDELVRLTEERAVAVARVQEIDEDLHRLRAIRRAAGVEDPPASKRSRAPAGVSEAKLEEVRNWLRTYDGEPFTANQGAGLSGINHDTFRRSMHQLRETGEVQVVGTSAGGGNLLRPTLEQPA
jgi:response regulator of citrate/malate metabolism